MKAFRKDILREIVKSKSRFLSILIIVLLGTLVFVGLGTTVFDIKKNINAVLKEENVYDIRVDSMLPFTKRDKELINKLSNIERVEYKYESIDKDNNLEIENKDLKRGDKVELENSLEGSKYYDISYLSKNSFKNGIKINKMFYVNNDAKDENVALIYLKKDKKIDFFSKEYLNFTKKYKDELRRIFLQRPANAKLEIISKLDEGLEKIKDANTTINENIEKLKKEEEKLVSSREKLDSAPKIFDKHKLEIANGKKEILKNKNELIENKKKVEDGLSRIKEKMPEVLSGLAQIETEEKKLEKNKNSIFLSKEKYEQYRKEIDENKEKLYSVLKTNKELSENLDKINDGLKLINSKESELLKNEVKLNNEIRNYNNTYKENLNKINNGFNEIKNAYKEIEKKEKELETKKSELNEIKENLIKPIYTITSIFDNLDFLTIYNNIASMNVISLVFSLLFFIIALFIVSTTIIRFSIEQRSVIGTYKFLGYSNETVIYKFMIYALIPTVIGITIGTLVGTYIIPKIIYPAFFTDVISIFNDFKHYGEIKSILSNMFILIIVIVMTILIILNSILKEKVIELLTSKKEKPSRFKIKNILLRNLLKYKLRLFMTIFGIGLCTSLIYLGIGIKYSIEDIANIQYGTIQKMDASVYFKPSASEKEIEEYISNIKNDANVLKLNTSEVKIEHKNREYTLQKVEIIDGHYKDFFNFDLDNGEVILSENIYILSKLKNNSNLKYLDRYNIPSNIKVDDSFENYISDYMYVKNKNAKTNSLIVQYKGANKPNLKSDIVYNVIYTNDMRNIFNLRIKSLNIIVLFMIFLGGSLAIIVTYNLGNINIIERRRELATLEVLGYKEKELDLYIFREIIILAVISTAFGIGLGRLLHRLVAYQFRTSIQLVLNINLKVILFSFTLPLIFVFIVLLILKKKIKSINMIESLKMSE